MSQNPNGWIPYGAVDDSIIFQHSLTTPLVPADIAGIATALAIGSTALTWDNHGSILHGHNVTHHPEFGMKAVSNADSLTECGYRFAGGGEKLDGSGQLSFQLERAYVCRSDEINFSSGFVPTTTNYAMSHAPLSGAAGAIGAKATTGEIYASGSVFLGLSVAVHSAGKPDFVTINIGWAGGRVGGQCWMAVDGHVIDTGARSAATLASMIDTLYLGNDRGIAGTFMASHYMRNLQISTRPPMFAAHPSLRHLGMISDSILSSGDPSNPSFRDVISSVAATRELAKSGHSCGTVTVTSVGGARLDNSVDGGVTQYIKTQLTTLLLLKPTVVVIRGGTNDSIAGRCSFSTWQAAITDYITACMAVDSVRRVIFLGIPSGVGDTSNNTATFQSERAIGDTKLKAAVDAWRTANPTDTRNVTFVADMYTILGGEYPTAGTYKGQVSGAYNDLHLSGYGHYLHGKAIAEAVIKELGTA